MPRWPPGGTIGEMPDTSDPRGDRRLRLVLDEHERERGELAHELHEQVAQGLAVVLLGLDRIPPADDRSPRIAAVRELVLDALEHCRALAAALRPSTVDAIERARTQPFGAHEQPGQTAFQGPASVSPRQ